jgi:hypothetical protein
MKPIVFALLTLVFALLALDANASCYRCRDSLCWMAEGTGAECHYVTGGCATSGNCNDPNGGGAFCGTYPEPDCQGYAAPLSQQWQLAEVTVKSAPPTAARLASARPAAPRTKIAR